MTLGAVIVTYNSAGDLAACLESVTSAGISAVVVDNASQDATAEIASRFPNVHLIRNPSNRGFGAAANQGVAALTTDIILLLNPDTRLVDSPAPLLSAFDDPSLAAAGGQLLDDSGETQRGFQFRSFPTPVLLAFELLGLNALFPFNPLNRRYRCLGEDATLPRDVDQPAGAFLALRREAFLAIGGFDEAFHPIWFEDVDLCRRLRAAGGRIAYLPGIRARHRGAGSISVISWEERQLYWYGSLLRYARKHFSRSGSRLVESAAALSCWPRAFFGVLLQRTSMPLFVYGRVFRFAIACLFSSRSPRFEGLASAPALGQAHARGTHSRPPFNK